MRRAIGVVSQRSGADPVATGRDNLTLQGRLHGMRGSALRHRVDELLDRFDLAAAAGRAVRTYSGGMQRRLDVALGLVHRPQVLFLDEPTTGLDPAGRAAIWSEIARLAAGEALAIVLATHYMDEADRLAGRLAIVDHGVVVVTGTPDQLKSGVPVVTVAPTGPSLDDVYLRYAGRRLSADDPHEIGSDVASGAEVVR